MGISLILSVKNRSGSRSSFSSLREPRLHHIHVRAASSGAESVAGPARHHAVQGFHQDVRHVVCQHLGADEYFAEL